MGLKFGVVGSGQRPEGMPAGGFFRSFAQQAESLGFDSLWTTDHISFVNPILEGIVALSAFAGCTERILLGTGIYLLPLRHPSAVAKQVASLDHLSEGRVIFGIGVGGDGEKDFEAVQVPVAERGARTNEAILALRALWRDKPASFAGKHYAFEDVTIAPAPVQSGGPPIVIGGRSEAALRRAGTLADGWLAYMVSPERFGKDFSKVREHAHAAGRSSSDLWAGIVLPTYVHEDDEFAARVVRDHLTRRYGRPFDDHHVERYALAGSPARVRARLDEYAAAGVGHIVFNSAGPGDTDLEELAILKAGVVRPLRAQASANPR